MILKNSDVGLVIVFCLFISAEEFILKAVLRLYLGISICPGFKNHYLTGIYFVLCLTMSFVFVKCAKNKIKIM